MSVAGLASSYIYPEKGPVLLFYSSSALVVQRGHLVEVLTHVNHYNLLQYTRHETLVEQAIKKCVFFRTAHIYPRLTEVCSYFGVQSTLPFDEET